VISIKANCIDSTAAPEAVFAAEVQKLRAGGLKPLEQLYVSSYLSHLEATQTNHLAIGPWNHTSVTMLLVSLDRVSPCESLC
jgi:hypothetical protein